jgi:hypothetical protein
MDELTLTQSLLFTTPCPGCGRKAFDLALRCDTGGGACRYLAVCTACGHQYDVPRAEPIVTAAQPCERCPDGSREPVIRCDTRTSRCEVVWVCGQCEGLTAPALAL